MKIESFSIQNYKCIKDLAVDCRGADGEIRQWTVLLGENNTGKTNVLRALSYLVTTRFDTTGAVGDEIVYRRVRFLSRGKIESYGEEKKKDPFVKAMLSNGEEWTSYSEKKIKGDVTSYLDIFPYGVSRFPARVALSERESLPHKTLFTSDARLLDLQEWLLQLDYSKQHGSSMSQKRLEKMHELLKSELFPEIKGFKFGRYELENDQVSVRFETIDGDVCFEELGFGYQTTLTWLADFCKRMFELYPDAENPLHEEAVALVDEIDLHLHPKWQRDLVPTLSKIFPNVQFIVTTHSPHVLQSMEDVNLYVLRRDAESGEVAFKHCPRSDFRGWTVEDILSETMGLGEKIHSDYYNLQVEDFNEALDEDNLQRAEKAYKELDRLMKADDPLRRMFDLQLGQLKRRYDQA